MKLKTKKGTRSFEDTLRLVEQVEKKLGNQIKGECWCGSNHHIDDLLDTPSTSSISNKSEEITEDVTKDEEITPSKPFEELPGEVQYIKHCRTCICK